MYPVENRIEGVLFDIDVQNWIDLITNKPSAIQNDYVNTMISDMKDGLGVERMSDWSDVFYHLAAETAEASLKNLVKDAHHAVAVNSPTFTSLEGWQGDGISARINMNYDPSTQGVNYKANDNTHIGYWRELGNATNKSSLWYISDKNKARYIVAGNGDYIINCSIDATGYYAEPRPRKVGFITSRRNGTTQYQGYGKGYGTGTKDYQMTSGSGYLELQAGNQVSFFATGKYLIDDNMNIIIDSFQALMTKNGKEV